MATQTGTPSHHIVIGVAVKNSPDQNLARSLGDIATVSDWPINPRKIDHLHPFKVKSAVYFGDQPGQGISWGSNVPDVSPDSPRKPIEFFKLLFLPTGMVTPKIQNCEYFRDAASMARLCNRQPEEVAAGFLQCVWDHARRHIVNHVSQDHKRVTNPTFHFVITLPAGWPKEAQRSMLRALRFGMSLDSYPGRTVSLITEADAAALHVAANFARSSNQIPWVVGDAFTIVDTGGATVYLVTYRVKNIDPIEIDQCTWPTAILAGGVFVDDAFVAALRRKATEVFPSEPPLSRHEVAEISSSQLSLDLRLLLDRHSSITVNLPARFDRAAGSAAGEGRANIATIDFTRGDLEDIFLASGIRQISQAVASQANKANATFNTTVKAGLRPNSLNEEAPFPLNICQFVYLVGGYAQYDYLLEWLQHEHGEARSVIRQDAETGFLATVRGAVVHGLNSLSCSMNSATAVGATVLYPESRASFGICAEVQALPWGDSAINSPRTGTFTAMLSKSNAVVNVKIYACSVEPRPTYKTPSVVEFTTLSIAVDLDKLGDLTCDQARDGTTLYRLPIIISICLLLADRLMINASHRGQPLIAPLTASNVGL
ncbi:hypothetical protein QBC33DRAFT_555050 [Phialemonium atrogriseum]|uniref:Uncharacterized protein n=1 Tax=Phialemonium atrogriseum TaxID=1093897 RepID=A0AAJ0CAU9_9PEZI|nr:uncharacterized protein QBC33DRAFT_555050 [Phialemonium atrogriseum]KAK1771892.1 hypothetical protein QBC33DRAFT_555050 [Phialemonium atrogriseum]